MTLKPLASVGNLSLSSIVTHNDSGGSLAAFEGGRNVPFSIARVFVVQAGEGQIRGQHAHKKCQQFLVCTAGAVQVTCTDGREERVFQLNKLGQALLIPEGIWAEQKYLEPNTVLTVFCDRPYEDSDYLREQNEFLEFRANRGEK
jgi:dTDP-4-dehydrorhamnose 3,5-epimerase-like enzyme